MMRTRIALWFTICVSVAPIRSRAADEPTNDIDRQGKSRLRNMLAINEDNSHFFGTRKPEDMTMEGLLAFVDQYAGSAVTHLFLNPNAMRASFRSSSRDAIWDPVAGKEPVDLWPQNAKRLFAAGLDPYEVWINRCREKGISPWLSMRMNDVHSVDESDNFMHSSFWREHPQSWRVPHGAASPWVNRAMNYAHAEVREHQMAFVRELLERYDPDGLELDWMRFGYHLTPGREREEGAILTEFVRTTRALTKDWSTKRGHPILLGVRVPAHPDSAAGLGMDAVAWAREGLVDLLVPCPFWSSSDFDIPVERWRERLGEVAGQVTVAPGLEYNARPWPGGAAVANDLACARGFAASAHQRGADSLYLFNWMDSETRPVEVSDYQVLLRDGLSPQAVSRTLRRHPVCYRDTVPAGFPSDIRLPVDAQAGGSFQIHIGPKPESADVWAVVGLASPDAAGETRWEASLNDHPLGAAENVTRAQDLGGGAIRAIRILCPPETVAEGYNRLSIRQVAGLNPQQIVWVELRVAPH
jgi:hypothetical protein